MSEAVNQFIQIIRSTWLESLYCETCGKDTQHTGHESGAWEIYVCKICRTEKRYKVK